MKDWKWYTFLGLTFSGKDLHESSWARWSKYFSSRVESSWYFSSQLESTWTRAEYFSSRVDSSRFFTIRHFLLMNYVYELDFLITIIFFMKDNPCFVGWNSWRFFGGSIDTIDYLCIFLLEIRIFLTFYQIWNKIWAYSALPIMLTPIMWISPQKCPRAIRLC
jgi:hypothetical protein